jgi:perosamine synthetase
MIDTTKKNVESPERTIETYKNTIRKEFEFLKKTTTSIDLFAKAIDLPDQLGCLVPVCEMHANDEQLISVLAKWRADNSFAFPTQFPVTLAGTRSWLRSKLLDVEDRLLFLVLDKHGYYVGHLGYANALNDNMEIEVDNVIRGEKNASKGIMNSAMKALIKWAEDTIWPETIYLRVLQDNHHAIDFYHKLEFKNDCVIPLRRHEKDKEISYTPLEKYDKNPPDSIFQRMVFTPSFKSDKTSKILTAGPSISARESSYVMDAVRYGWNNQWSGYIKSLRLHLLTTWYEICTQ